MKSAQITTVIPTYRRPHLLARAIASVLAQSYGDFKVCVYDNDPSYESREVVEGYQKVDPRVVYIQNESNLGAIGNIEKGVSAVDTPYYSILNDDDFLLPWFYTTAIDAFRTHPDSGFVCARTITVDLTTRTLQPRNKDWVPGFYEPGLASVTKMSKSHFTQTGVLLRADIRKRIGLFERSGDDALYMVLAAAAAPFCVIPHYGGVYLIHPQSYSIETGLRGEDLSKICEALSASLNSAMALSLSPDRTLHLIGVIIDAYAESLNSRRWSNLLRPNVERQWLQIPTFLRRATRLGVAADVFERMPPALQLVLRPILGAVRNARRERNISSVSRSWLPLPDPAYRFCNGDTKDLRTFIDSMRDILGDSPDYKDSGKFPD